MATTKKRGRRPDPNAKGAMLGIRVEQVELDRLDAVAGQLIGLGSRTGVARAALLIGLAMIEKDPSILLGNRVRR
jgi:hypothetical protein